MGSSYSNAGKIQTLEPELIQQIKRCDALFWDSFIVRVFNRRVATGDKWQPELASTLTTMSLQNKINLFNKPNINEEEERKNQMKKAKFRAKLSKFENLQDQGLNGPNGPNGQRRRSSEVLTRVKLIELTNVKNEISQEEQQAIDERENRKVLFQRIKDQFNQQQESENKIQSDINHNVESYPDRKKSATKKNSTTKSDKNDNDNLSTMPSDDNDLPDNDLATTPKVDNDLAAAPKVDNDLATTPKVDNDLATTAKVDNDQLEQSFESVDMANDSTDDIFGTGQTNKASSETSIESTVTVSDDEGHSEKE